MSWSQVPIKAPLVDGIEDIATGLSSVISQISPILDTATSLLEVAKSFFLGGGDPYSVLGNLVLDQLEDLNNDIFGSGVFLLSIVPGKSEKLDPAKPTGKDIPFTNGFFKQSIEKPIDPVFGISQLTPGEAIRLMQNSLDDLGDPLRPQFSDSAVVTAFGLLVTAPTLEDFISLNKALSTVFKYQPVVDLYEDLEKVLDKDPVLTGIGGLPPHRHTYNVDGSGNGETQSVVAENPNVKIPPHTHEIKVGKVVSGIGNASHTHSLFLSLNRTSRHPNWESVRFNSFEPMLGMQKEINKSIAYARGLLTGADDVLGDLIRVIETKLNTLKTIVEDLNELITTIKNALLSSGVYLLDLPPTLGGNQALRDAFSDDDLRKLTINKFTTAIIVVGGGASLVPVDTIRQLLT